MSRVFLRKSWDIQYDKCHFRRACHRSTNVSKFSGVRLRVAYSGTPPRRCPLRDIPPRVKYRCFGLSRPARVNGLPPVRAVATVSPRRHTAHSFISLSIIHSENNSAVKGKYTLRALDSAVVLRAFHRKEK